MTEAPVTDLDLAEVERLLEAPQGLVETVALARVVCPLLSALKAERERAAQVWRSIETAPTTETDDDPWRRIRILTWSEFTGVRTGDLYRGRASHGEPVVHLSNVHGNAVENGWATHWQPLPSPPGDRT